MKVLTAIFAHRKRDCQVQARIGKSINQLSLPAMTDSPEWNIGKPYEPDRNL
jgi:hypothetical protein